jgi:phage-related protein
VKPVVWLGDSLARVRQFSPEVYVLHAFEKRSRKTARADIELARRRFRSLVHDRRQQWLKN